MTDLVPTDRIECIVGARRHVATHIARAVSSEQRVYILHSQRCLNDGRDLRKCPFSVALDRGISMDAWRDQQDRAVVVMVSIRTLQLIPLPFRDDEVRVISEDHGA